jgi:hypothetical protein
MAAPGTRLRININPSPYLRDYINSYPNVIGILEQGDSYFVINTTMTSTQITQFKSDCLNKVIEII